MPHLPEPSPMNRRRFLQRSAGAFAGLAASPSLVRAASEGGAPLSGLQIAPHSVLDEGMDRCLDILQEKAAVDTLFIYTHTYTSATNRPPEVLAQDHGVTIPDQRGRKLPWVWVEHDDSAFSDTSLRHHRPGDDYEYRDAAETLFPKLIENCHARGMKVYGRILQASLKAADLIENFDDVVFRGLDGEPVQGASWFNEDFIEFERATVENTFRNYELDGFQYGAEMTGPLSHVIFKGDQPNCFDAASLRHAESAGIDIDRMRTGYQKLHDLINGLKQGGEKPVDGVFSEVLRVFQYYPEVLEMNREVLRADLRLTETMLNAAREARPGIECGTHVDHQRSSWDIFYRSAIPYSDIAAFSDFIKPIVYHDSFGLRLRGWVIERYGEAFLSELSFEQSTELFWSLFGHDPETMPGYDELAEVGSVPTDYVRRETERVVAGAGDDARVYPGIGFDNPWYAPHHVPMESSPEGIEANVHAAFEAGADGIVASREYDEMRMPSLEAFGRAMREHGA